ncbi:MAG TPA: hypothetical protein VF770_03385 [Solirubrobacterales bacterium]
MAPGPSASAEEAAAIAAAIERFQADTAPATGAKAGLGPWRRAALIEGVGARGTIGDLDGKGGTRWLS